MRKGQIACMLHVGLGVLVYNPGYVMWRRTDCMHTLRPNAQEPKSQISMTKACNKRIPLDPLHPIHSLLILTQKMAPSSEQLSSTATPTDPNLHLSTTPQSNSHLPASPTMNSHTLSPPAHVQEMADLEQIWSGLSLEHLHDETVSFVRIPIHPRKIGRAHV